MTTAWPRSGSSISVEEFDRLPADIPHRLEIEDGRLLVTDLPGGPHIIAAQRLARCLDDQLPDELEAMVAFLVELAEPSPRRVPDLVVCVVEACDQVRVRPDQILLDLGAATGPRRKRS